MVRKENKIIKPLIKKGAIKKRINELVDEIAGDIKRRELVAIGILTGSFIFLADLVRGFYRHKITPRIDFMIVSSYGSGVESSGRIKIIQDITTDIKNSFVLIVDDILDTGQTLGLVSRHLLNKQPAKLKTCVFLDKQRQRVIPFQADYVGFKIPDVYVVGYGLDYDNRYRELPYVAEISKSQPKQLK